MPLQSEEPSLTRVASLSLEPGLGWHACALWLDLITARASSESLTFAGPKGVWMEAWNAHLRELSLRWPIVTWSRVALFLWSRCLAFHPQIIGIEQISELAFESS